MGQIAEQCSKQVGIQPCRMNAKSIQFLVEELMIHNNPARISIVPCHTSTTCEDEKAALIVYDLLSNEEVELTKVRCGDSI
jgi:hypothetical protein